MKDVSSYYETISAAILLSLVGGFIDVYVYVSRGAFAFAMTGNFVLMGVFIAKANYSEAFTKLLPIIVFFIGATSINYIKKLLTEKQFFKFEHFALMIQIITLFIIGFIPLHSNNYLIIVIITLLFSVQFVSFRKVDGLSYFSNLCSGNLHSTTDQLCSFFITKQAIYLKNTVKYFIIIISFVLGAILGAFSFNFFKEKAVWIACVLLIMVAINYLITKNLTLYKNKSFSKK